MSTQTRLPKLSLLALWSILLCPGVLRAEPVKVLHKEGLVHGFLTLRTLDGTYLADGELFQSVRGDRVTSRLVCRFSDGSVVDETSVFSQREHFRLISNHLVQKGPSFPGPIELKIDCPKGKITLSTTDKHGQQKVIEELIELPPDLANGMVLTLLKNVAPNQPPPTMTMLVLSPRPRLVKLVPVVGGEERFKTGGTTRQATHYVVKVDLGGVTGVIAPLIGKAPPDSHVWIMGGEAPAFVKSESPMFQDGPLWRLELASPVWPAPAAAVKASAD